MDLKCRVAVVALSLASVCYLSATASALADFTWPWEQVPVQKATARPARAIHGAALSSAETSKQPIKSRAGNVAPRSLICDNTLFLGVGF
jgi:hypothetical protein